MQLIIEADYFILLQLLCLPVLTHGEASPEGFLISLASQNSNILIQAPL